MTIGSLTAKIVLDDPKKIYYGFVEPVIGHVLITYRPGSSKDPTQHITDLFGPLRVTITVHARAKTKIIKNSGQNRRVYRGRAPLLSQSFEVHNGPIKCAAHKACQLPFAIRIATAHRTKQPTWKPDVRYGDSFLLPPTFNISYHGFAHRFDAFTEYRIGLDVGMPGIDITIHAANGDSEPHLLYGQLRTPLNVVSHEQYTANQHFMIQNEHLLPESDRPMGFKEKAKALFKSDYYPGYHFDVSFSAPRHLYLDENLMFEVSLHPDMKLSTAPVTPEVQLVACSASLKAQTVARAEQQLFTEPESEGNEIVVVLSALDRRLLPCPLSKANEFTKQLSLGPLTGVPSTFATFNIARSYTLEFKIRLEGANKHFDVERTFPVTVHPPIKGGVDGGCDAAVAGPSNAPNSEVTAQLPAYHEHEPLPEYGEAVGKG